MRDVPSFEDLAEDRARAFALTPVSRETEERIDCFVRMFLDRQRHVNLVAQSTLATLYTRHISDSLQLLSLAPSALSWLDLGSGGGFPAIPLACALVGRPDAFVDMVESVGKKADFLRQAITTLGLGGHVYGVRIEQYKPASWPDVITARALAPLPVLLPYVQPLLKKKGGVALLMKGQDAVVELTNASKSWSIEHRLSGSVTNLKSHVIVVTGVSQLSDRGPAQSKQAFVRGHDT